MKLLCIDTSTKNFSLAVSDGEKILQSRNVQLKRVLSSSIIPAIDGILRRSNLTLQGIDGLAVGLGPGSFTSLRVGLATIKGLSFATGKPVVGVGSLDVLAMNAVSDADSPICVLTDAKRGLVYSAMNASKKGIVRRTSDYELAPIAQILLPLNAKAIFIGDGIKLFQADILKKVPSAILVDEKRWFPQAKNLAPLVQERFRKKKFDDIGKLVPIYLYPQDCQVKR